MFLQNECKSVSYYYMYVIILRCYQYIHQPIKVLIFFHIKCPPVAVAIAKQQKKGASFSSSNSVEFPIIEISDVMGSESGPVKRELKMLQWSISETGTVEKCHK